MTNSEQNKTTRNRLKTVVVSIATAQRMIDLMTVGNEGEFSNDELGGCLGQLAGSLEESIRHCRNALKSIGLITKNKKVKEPHLKLIK